MKRYNNPNNIIHAMIITSQKLIDFLGKDLYELFINYKVILINIAPALAYGPDSVSLILSGQETNIKKCLSHLRKICYGKEIGIESKPIKSLPPVLKGYLSDMENKSKFEKIFSYCSKEYLDYCKTNNIKPHPEVVETITGN
ncbi:MAG: hypothetical protein HYY52_05315 [Candidatus Melainabacteria bacterium]|nr:hypothetical protein [Candidatus Melainabacteria bacterium]